MLCFQSGYTQSGYAESCRRYIAAGYIELAEEGCRCDRWPDPAQLTGHGGHASAQKGGQHPCFPPRTWRCKWYLRARWSDDGARGTTRRCVAKTEGRSLTRSRLLSGQAAADERGVHGLATLGSVVDDDAEAILLRVLVREPLCSDRQLGVPGQRLR